VFLPALLNIVACGPAADSEDDDEEDCNDGATDHPESLAA